MISILDAMHDDHIFGKHFQKNPDTWKSWEVFLKALFGLPMNLTQRELFRKCTQRDKPPTKGSNEAWLIVGRRGGKSFILAMAAIYLASFRDYREFLGPGERGTIAIVAADRKQGRTILRYCLGLLRAVPMLSQTIEGSGKEYIDLSNKLTIEIHTASFRSVRGYSIVAALLDELAFFRSDEGSANPDHEILAAVRPAMATIPNAMLLCASSPYARRGALWDEYRKHFGKDEDGVLVWQADTRTMNPSVPQKFIDNEVLKDPASAAAEYGAQFRLDIEAFLSREAVESCVVPDLRELAYTSSHRYNAFVDPSGGSSDSFTLAISHRDGDKIVIDAIREARPPFSPEAITDEFCDLLKSYHIGKVTGDRYGGEWPRERFRKCGISYEVAETVTSDLYRDLLPKINSRKVELLDHPRLISQLSNLERRTARSGKDSIGHGPGAHDDIANAIAGVVFMAAAKSGPMKISQEVFAWARKPYRMPTSKIQQFENSRRNQP